MGARGRGSDSIRLVRGPDHEPPTLFIDENNGGCRGGIDCWLGPGQGIPRPVSRGCWRALGDDEHCDDDRGGGGHRNRQPREKRGALRTANDGIGIRGAEPAAADGLPFTADVGQGGGGGRAPPRIERGADAVACLPAGVASQQVFGKGGALNIVQTTLLGIETEALHVVTFHGGYRSVVSFWPGSGGGCGDS